MPYGELWKQNTFAKGSDSLQPLLVFIFQEKNARKQDIKMHNVNRNAAHIMKRFMTTSQIETSVESSVSHTFINIILLMGKKP